MGKANTMSTIPVIERGTPCDHTEHAIAPVGYSGRYFPDRLGGPGAWEPCPNEPSYGDQARAEALIAGDPGWSERTVWNPAKDRPADANSSACSTLDLAGIKVRAAAASAGPWVLVSGRGGQVYGPIVMVAHDGEGKPYEDRGHIATAGIEDAIFIAQTPTDIAALVAEVERQRAAHAAFVRSVDNALMKVAEGGLYSGLVEELANLISPELRDA